MKAVAKKSSSSKTGKTKPQAVAPPPVPAVSAPLRQIETVLLPYQQRLFHSASTDALVVYEKSRRIGITWAVASAAVLTAAKAKSAGGMDVLYLGYALDMTREFVDTCASFARAIEPAAASVHEFLFDDGSEKGVNAFRIAFGSGFEIVALTSKPRSLRGRQGLVILDEAAFHDDLDEVLKAAMALLIWGGRVVVISSHDGADNPFNRLILEIRAGKRKGTVLRTTFDDALADGLYKRICYVQGKQWSPEAEAAWRAEIYGFYGTGSAEELDVVPAAGSGTWLSRGVLETRTIDVPVLRIARDAAFTMLPVAAREADIDAWLAANVAPLLGELHPHRIAAFGLDFGREVDRSVLWPIQRDEALVWRPPFLVEMSGVPFEQQRQILFFVCNALGSRLVKGAMDKGGNGAYLAEVAMQAYGSRIEPIQLSDGWYREHMPKLKAGLDDGIFLVPRDADVVDDLMQFKLVGGVARLPPGASRVGSDGLGRHGDAGIAGALARYASTAEPIAYDYTPVLKAALPEHGNARDMRMRADTQGDDEAQVGIFAGGSF